MSIVKRGQIIDSLCRKVAIRRVQFGSPYLSKLELVQLNAWVDTMVNIRQSERRKEVVTSG